MGIKDLLRFMKPYIEHIHIKKYAGKRVGIDAYSWLHKGAYSCSMEICLDSDGNRKSRYLDYFMHRIELLRFYKIIPVVVFDGGNIPCKAATENERYKKRRANFELAMEKLKEGNVNAASELFQRAVNITPLMAHKLIQILRSEKVEFVVAPYEADAQLAYLSSLEAEEGGLAAVITEDSDLLAYGCRATVFKMDRYGNGEELVLDQIFHAANRKPSFQFFDKDLFTGMCVLAGCDFLPSVPGIGIVKAHSFVSKYRNLDRVLSILKLEKGNQMPEDYNKSFKEALAVFQHARIYDANKKTLKHMRPLAQNLLEYLDGKLDFLGPEIPSSVATAIAEGKLNPMSMEAFDSSSFSRDHSETPFKLQKPDTFKLQKPDINAASRDKKCFAAIKGTSMEQSLVSSERRQINEALALQKVVTRKELRKTAKTMIATDLPAKVPLPFNPFLIRKREETHADQTEISAEQASDTAEVENLNAPSCKTPDGIPSKFPDRIFPKKRKVIIENQLEPTRSNVTEQASDVTEVAVSDNLSVLKGSQESVNSKPNRIPDRKVRVQNGKSKKSKQRDLEKNTSTILSFFSPV